MRDESLQSRRVHGRSQVRVRMKMKRAAERQTSGLTEVATCTIPARRREHTRTLTTSQGSGGPTRLPAPLTQDDPVVVGPADVWVLEGNDLRKHRVKHLSKRLKEVGQGFVCRPEREDAAGMKVVVEATQLLGGVELRVARVKMTFRRVIDVQKDDVVTDVRFRV